MYKKIFITGGTGFIGSYVVKKLFQLGYDLTVLDNNSRGKISRILEDYKNAEIYIRQAIELNPNFEEARLLSKEIIKSFDNLKQFIQLYHLLLNPIYFLEVI